MNFDTAAWSCSFCGKRASEDTRFAGGLGALMCQECLESFSLAIAAPENAHIKILGWSHESMSDAEMLARLPLIAATARQVDRYLRLWVGKIRELVLLLDEIDAA